MIEEHTAHQKEDSFVSLAQLERTGQKFPKGRTKEFYVHTRTCISVGKSINFSNHPTAFRSSQSNFLLNSLLPERCSLQKSCNNDRQNNKHQNTDHCLAGVGLQQFRHGLHQVATLGQVQQGLSRAGIRTSCVYRRSGMMVTVGIAAKDQLPAAIDYVTGVVFRTRAIHLVVARMARSQWDPVRRQLVVKNGGKLTVDFLAAGADPHWAHFEQVMAEG